MKPKNFPDRKERRRRAARVRAGLPAENTQLRPKDINLRLKAGERRVPGHYIGLGKLLPHQKAAMKMIQSSNALTYCLDMGAGLTRVGKVRRAG